MGLDGAPRPGRDISSCCNAPVNSALECRQAALINGLQLGAPSLPFIGNYSTSGCFTEVPGGKLCGHAFFSINEHGSSSLIGDRVRLSDVDGSNCTVHAADVTARVSNSQNDPGGDQISASRVLPIEGNSDLGWELEGFTSCPTDCGTHLHTRKLSLRCIQQQDGKVLLMPLPTCREVSPEPDTEQVCQATEPCPSLVSGLLGAIEVVAAAVAFIVACVVSHFLPADRLQAARASSCCCMLWYLLFPFTLVAHFFRIFVLPCIISYALGTCGKLWLLVGNKLCCCLRPCKCLRRMSCCICFYFEDGEFPPHAKSIGEWKDKSLVEVENEIEWKRGGELFKHIDSDGDGIPDGAKARLFSGEIEPNDIGQGQLGDCWLLTAIVCLAEFPGAIQSVFETHEYNTRGRYCVKLFDGYEQEWKEVVIDDYIPCYKNTDKPIFANPNGQELHSFS